MRLFHPDLVGIGVSLVGAVATAVVIAVEALVVIPVIAPPGVAAHCAGAVHRNMGEIPLEHIVGDDVAGALVVEQHADAVVGDAVAADPYFAVGLVGRQVGGDAGGAIDDVVVLHHRVARFLEADAHAGGAGGVRDDVVAEGDAFRVHDVDTHGIVVIAVALHQVGLGEHEVHGVAAAPAEVVADVVAVGIPDHEVARIDQAVALDQVVHAVPQAQAVAAHAEVGGFGGDTVVAHDVFVGLAQVDAEQAVVNDQVFGHVAVPAYFQAGVLGVVRIARAGEMQAAQHGAIGGHGEHAALIAGVDGDAPRPIDGERLGQIHRPGIGAGRRAQQRAGGRGIHQRLERLQAVDAFVPHIERVGRFRRVQFDPHGEVLRGAVRGLLLGREAD